MDGQVPADVVQQRYERLTALVEETSLDGNLQFTGRQVEVLVADGEGRKDAATHRMSGRARDNRLVHFAPAGSAVGSGGSPPRDSRPPRPGDVVTTGVTRAAPHYLIADGEPVAVRRTRRGDAWAARSESIGRDQVLLGMPSVGPPAYACSSPPNGPSRPAPSLARR